MRTCEGVVTRSAVRCLIQCVTCLLINSFVGATLTTTTKYGTTTFSANSSSDCWCDCHYVMAANLTLEQLQLEVQRIYQALLLDKNNISATVRKRISVPDYRPSAQSIGYVGILVLVTSLGSIVALDITTLLKDVKTGLANVKNFLTKPKVCEPDYKSIRTKPDENVHLSLTSSA